MYVYLPESHIYIFYLYVNVSWIAHRFIYNLDPKKVCEMMAQSPSIFLHAFGVLVKIYACEQTYYACVFLFMQTYLSVCIYVFSYLHLSYIVYPTQQQMDLCVYIYM